MQTKYYKILGVTIVLVVCSTLIVGWILRRPLKPQNASIDDNRIPNIDVLLQLGSGMGPNLMTRANSSSNYSADLSFDELVQSVSEELVFDGTTRRYMSVLIDGEGCKFYVDNGDGRWVLVDASVADLHVAESGDDPFGEPLTDSSPFD